MTEIAVRTPPLDELARRWREIEPHLQRACDVTGCFEPIDILALTFAGKNAIWVVEDHREAGYRPIGEPEIIAALVIKVEQYPRRRVLEVPYIGGKHLSLWKDAVIARLEEAGRAAGCSHIAGFQRKGWARAADFKISGVILTRDL